MQRDAIREGAVLCVRPKAMTVAVIIAGLVPIMVASGTGSEIMQRIAAPEGGWDGVRTTAVDVCVPAVYLSMRRRAQAQTGCQRSGAAAKSL